VGLTAVWSFSTLWKHKPAAPPLICLKGNHDDLMHTTLTAPLDPEWWARSGGEATLKSYNNEVPTNHLDWVKNLPTMYVDRHRIFVHVGIDPTKALDDQTDKFMLWHRHPENADWGGQWRGQELAEARRHPKRRQSTIYI
jgi:serine/threonine protein phosphatase 1